MSPRRLALALAAVAVGFLAGLWWPTVTPTPSPAVVAGEAPRSEKRVPAATTSSASVATLGEATAAALASPVLAVSDTDQLQQIIDRDGLDHPDHWMAVLMALDLCDDPRLDKSSGLTVARMIEDVRRMGDHANADRWQGIIDRICRGRLRLPGGDPEEAFSPQQMAAVALAMSPDLEQAAELAALVAQSDHVDARMAGELDRRFLAVLVGTDSFLVFSQAIDWSSGYGRQSAVMAAAGHAGLIHDQVVLAGMHLAACRSFAACGADGLLATVVYVSSPGGPVSLVETILARLAPLPRAQAEGVAATLLRLRAEAALGVRR